MVQLFVNETYVGPEWIPFQDYLFERVCLICLSNVQVAMPIINNKIMKRNTFSIVCTDGNKYQHWIKNAGLKDTTLPAYFLIDFVLVQSTVNYQDSGLKYASRTVSTMDTLDSDLYRFLDEHSLGLLPPLQAEADEAEL